MVVCFLAGGRSRVDDAGEWRRRAKCLRKCGRSGGCVLCRGRAAACVALNMTRFGPTHADLGPWDLLYSCICFYPFPSFTQRLFEPTKPQTVRLPTHLAVSCLLSSLGRKNSPQKTLLKTPPPPHQCQKTPQHRLATDRLAASFLADHFRNHPTSRASTARFPHQAGHFPFPHGLVREMYAALHKRL